MGNEGAVLRVGQAVHGTSMSFDQWINEATCTPLVGWDLSFLKGRYLETPPSWDFRSRIQEFLPQASAMLDMGTGGGEFLQSLGSLPADTIATEGFEPNVAVASRNLKHSRISVVDVSTGPSLPFPDNRFDLVMNRHEAFEASAVARVLKPKGRFVTQQVGGQDMIGLNQLIQDEVNVSFAGWNKDFVVDQLEGSGFDVVNQMEEYPPVEFLDLAAVIHMLNITPWQIADFSVQRYRDRLYRIYEIIQQDGKLTVHSHRFFVEAVRR